jgi:hypothetical protein
MADLIPLASEKSSNNKGGENTTAEPSEKNPEGKFTSPNPHKSMDQTERARLGCLRCGFVCHFLDLV